MDVLLINPPRKIPQKADFPPLGLAYISSSLKQSGIDSGILDASSFTWKKLEHKIKEKSPRIAGIPCWTLEREQAYKTAKLIKKILPDTRIIMGAHHASAFPGHMFQLAEADAVVIGEGEITTCELTKAMLNNKDMGNIKGIAFLKDNKVIITEKRELIKNLDTIPLPCYNDFDLDDYLGLPESKERSAAIMTSRGCPYQCIFCSSSKFWQRRWRPRSAENVVDEIDWLYNDYNIKAFMFFDDNFMIRKERAIDICKSIISRKLLINWAACSHVNNADKELLNWMSKAGCYRIDYGVETGSSAILKNINKQQTVNQIEKAFQLTHDAGIKPRAYLMVGNPGENEDTIAETVSLVKRIKPHDTSSGQLLWILPDTEIYEIAKTKGIISDDFWINSHSMVYFTAEHSLNKLKSLRNELSRGIAENEGNIILYIWHIVRLMYYKFPVLQKFRKWRRKYACIAD